MSRLARFFFYGDCYAAMLKLNLLSRIVGVYRGMLLFLLLLSLLLLLALSALREGGSSSLADFSFAALLLC